MTNSVVRETKDSFITLNTAAVAVSVTSFGAAAFKEMF